MLKIAASVYGDPASEEWVPSWNSTQVGLEVRAATLCDLPMCIDEAGVVDEKQRERAVYMLINGAGRTRGERGGGLRDTSSWRTIVLSTGEHLLAAENANTGAQVRVMQFHVYGFGQLDAPGVDELRAACEENFGHIGRRWLELLVSESDWSPHRTELKRWVRQAQALAPPDSLAARRAGFVGLLAFTEAIAAAELGLGDRGGETMMGLASLTDASQQQVRSVAERALELARDFRQARSGLFGRILKDAGGGSKVTGLVGDREVVGYTDDRAVIAMGVLPLFVGGGGDAFAAVLERFKNFNTLSMTVTQRMHGKTMPATHTVVTASGILRTDIGTQLSVVVDPVHGRVLTLLHEARKAMVASLPQPGATADASLAWLDELRAFKGKATPMPGTRMIEGQTARGWSLQVAGSTIEIWADADGLPLSMRMHGETPLEIDYRFTFNQPIAAELLSTDAPAGYETVAADEDN